MDTNTARATPYYSSLLALAVDRPRDEFFPALRAALAERMPVDYIEVCAIDADGTRRVLYRHAPHHRVDAFAVDEPLVAAAMHSGVAQTTKPDQRTQTHLRLAVPDSVSFVVAPLRTIAAAGGYLAVGTLAGRPFDQADVDDVNAAADVASLVLNAATSSEAASARDEELRVLLDTARALSSERDLEKLFARVHGLVGGVMDATTFFIALADWENATVSVPYCVDSGKVIEAGEYPLDGSASGSALRLGRPLILRTLDDWKSTPSVLMGEGDPVESALFAPLRIGERLIGVISVQSAGREAYTDRDLTLLVAIAEQAAIAVEHSHALMRAEQQTRELTLLAEVSRALSAQLSLRSVYQTVCREVRRAMDATVFFVGLISADGVTLSMEFCVQGDVEFSVDPVPLAQSIAHRVVTSGAPLVLQTQPEIYAAPFRRLHYDGKFVHSIAMAPIRLGTHCLGVLSAQSYRERAYDETAVRLLAAIAEQMALAIQNAQLFAEAHNRADRDPLTGIYHHRYLKTRLDEEIKRAERAGHSLCVLMLDIDRFKLVNDNYGHPAGDEALRMLTSVLVTTCRSTDIVGRYGGDEFLIILPDGDEAQALRAAQRIREGLAARVLELRGVNIPLTASIGVAEYPRDGAKGSDLIARADAALYQSKRVGMPIGSGDSGASRRTIRLQGDFAPVHELLEALLARDPSTRAHLEQVNRLAARFAQVASLSESETQALLRASVLHDVGKIAIPDHVLCKPTSLTVEERELVRRHPEIGAMLLEHIPGLAEVAHTVLHHHERFDGGGYPRGLEGDSIPMLSRAVSIIDAFSAMTDDRPYHKGMSPHDALAELRRHAGRQFDPAMVELFASLVAEGSMPI